MSNPNYNEKSYNTLAPPHIQVRKNYDEGESKPTSIDIELSVGGVQTQDVRHFFLALVFNYTLEDVIPT